MAELSGIAWCDSSLSLWIGCTEVSPACHNCYARLWANRFHIEWNAPPVKTAESAWAKIAGYQRSAKRFHAKHGRPRRVFVNHMADFFDNQAEPAWQLRACMEMEVAPSVIFMLVTKRPQNVHKIVPLHWMRGGGWPKNVWLLVTAENQEEFDRRVWHLMDVPAPVRGVSIEPLLGELDCAWAFQLSYDRIGRHLKSLRPNKLLPRFIRPLEWGIIGGESGAKARSMPMPWAINVVEQIRRYGVGRAFMKQLSQADHPKTFRDFDLFPRQLQHREFPNHD